ncbi:MAG: preprotein translocase subunit SecE [Synergistaceae bacterium]|jgi:preprotein translocase subunit SecE|nr:preprotein translocase subunit SecE [Synergistaceae bacterium]
MKTVLDFYGRSKVFLRESKAELKKVSWPTKKQVWYSTLVVVVLTAVMGLYLGIVDFALTAILSRLAG